MDHLPTQARRRAQQSSRNFQGGVKLDEGPSSEYPGECERWEGGRMNESGWRARRAVKGR